MQIKRSTLILKIGIGTLLLSIVFSQGQESVESQLAPPGLPLSEAAPSAMLQGTTPPEQPSTPKLPVEFIDPSPHLPSLPSWIIVLTIALVLIPLVALAFYFLKEKGSSLRIPSTRNPFASARESLLALRELPSESPLAEISTRISLAIRQFLTESKSESALYQTREEFLTDEERLRHVEEPAKTKTADFLSELSSLQYAPPNSDPVEVTRLIDRSLEILNSLNQPPPSPTHPTPPQREVAAHD